MPTIEEASEALRNGIQPGREKWQDDVEAAYRPQLNPIEIRLSPSPDVTVLEWAKLNQVVYAAVLKAVKDAGLESRVR